MFKTNALKSVLIPPSSHADKFKENFMNHKRESSSQGNAKGIPKLA